MRSPARGPQTADPAARLSIGALSRATGIAVETLRTWENRYGFPRPERRPSGHRLYPIASVPRLRLIAQALVLGHRAGQVVGASEEALGQLLEAAPSRPPRSPAAAELPAEIEARRSLVSGFEADRLRETLVADWARLGPVEFLETRVAPLVEQVGEAWQQGELEIRHEHFLTEVLCELLGSLRVPLDERAQGPLVLCGTLPGERHGLGLQMAALVLAAAGWRTLYLGTEVPVPEFVALARDLQASAVAVSVSRASGGRQTVGRLRRLRNGVPRRVRLVVGGEGAPAAGGGIEVMKSLGALDAWARRLGLPAPIARGAAARGRRRDAGVS